MIGRLSGKLVSRSNHTLTIDVNGVGYEVYGAASLLQKAELTESIEAVIFTDVKEDSIQLYGFSDQMERQVFLLLKKVKGVGSKTAADIISRIDKLELLRVIGSGDASRIQSIKGIGKKLSERIVLELKEKVAEYVLQGHESGLVIESEPSVNGVFADALEALKSLGFSTQDAESSLKQVMSKNNSAQFELGEIIKEALRYV